MKKLVLIGLLFGLCLFAQGCKEQDRATTPVQTHSEETSQKNDLVYHEYDGTTIKVTSHTEIDLQSIREHAEIQELILYNCDTKEEKVIDVSKDCISDLEQGTYKIYARYKDGNKEDVTAQVTVNEAYTVQNAE